MFIPDWFYILIIVISIMAAIDFIFKVIKEIKRIDNLEEQVNKYKNLYFELKDSIDNKNNT